MIDKSDKIDPFSVRVLALDTALRFAYFSVQEAKLCREELKSSNLKKNEEGKQRAIRLFRTFRAKSFDYSRVRRYFDVAKKEDKMADDLKLLSRYAAVFLATLKERWKTEKALEILSKIISLEKDIRKLLKKLKKKTPSSSKYFYAGIDGGATSTKTVISNENGNILGRARAGPSFPNLVGVVKTFDSLITSLKKATENAGLNFETTYFNRICAGMCGIDKPEDHRRMNELMNKYITRFHPNIRSATIIQDSLLAWYGALDGDPGILVISGTGNVVFGYYNGRDAASMMKSIARPGREFIHLGGRALSYHVSLKIKKRLRKKQNTPLISDLIQAFRDKKKFPTLSKLPFSEAIVAIEESYFKKGASIPDKEVAAVAEVVFDGAGKGDEDAISVIKEASSNVCIYISEVAEKIGIHNNPSTPFKVSYVGSVMESVLGIDHLKKHLHDSLFEYEPYAKFVNPKNNPMKGALNIAIRNVRFY